MVSIDWLLQAGFRIRGATTSVAVDPYLSDACATIYGLQRRAPAPLTAEALDVAAVCISHWHEDHLDMPTVWAAATAGALVIAPPSCLARIAGLRVDGAGLDPERLRPILSGETVRVGDVAVTAVPARHAVPGYLTEDAVGYLVEVDGVRIYHSGDTEYDRTLLAAGVGGLDAALVCVNGTGGNMNAIEAAALVAQLAPRVAVPMHIGLWTDEGYGPEAASAPARFADACARLSPETQVAVAAVDQPLELVARHP